MISILLPTYNERDNIIRLIDAIDGYLSEMPHEIIVIDDDSPDKTWQAVAEKAQTAKHVKLIHRTNERGLTSAYNRGILESKGEILVWMDCDFSHPPEKIPEMIGLLSDQVQAVVASRYVPGGKDARETLWLPIFLSWLISQITRMILGINIRDVTSGFIAIDRTALLSIGELRGDYGEYFIDLVYRLIRKGHHILEIPYFCIPREYGESKTATNLWGFIRRGVKYLGTIALLRLSKP
ncbi:MAG: polyprenol monophosphomannose synthase [SAR324 cluster bacterium]|nr:polyprenol monophosphomannose synthase [SAR324 cluster bacterium]